MPSTNSEHSIRKPAKGTLIFDLPHVKNPTGAKVQNAGIAGDATPSSRNPITAHRSAISITDPRDEGVASPTMSETDRAADSGQASGSRGLLALTHRS